MLYVEGARDREILETWARRFEPGLARCVEQNSIILGGRQPARAVSDFQRRGGRAAGWRGLVVLDRDHHDDAALPDENGAGPAAPPSDTPEVFVWGLRHIESYLLVPAAIRRVLGFDARDPRVERALADPMVIDLDPAPDGVGAVHAKRILGAGGSLSEALGAELRAGQIARAMRAEELHDDVHTLFARIGELSGVAGLRAKGPEVVIREPRR